MSIITQNDLQISELSTLLQINCKGDGLELLEYNLPPPHNYQRDSRGYTLEYLIMGVFHTAKSAAYLNDVLLRFNLTFQVLGIEVKKVKARDNAIELREFQNLESVKRKVFIPRAYKYDDSVFWGLKLFVEHYISETGFVSYSVLEEYAIRHYFDHVKDQSTLRAKCRSIWNYYDSRNWKASKYVRKYTREEYEMTRLENIKKVHEQRKETSKRKVTNAVTGLFASEYKKKTGSWHISKIAKDLGIHRETVAKYLKEIESEISA